MALAKYRKQIIRRNYTFLGAMMTRNRTINWINEDINANSRTKYGKETI